MLFNSFHFLIFFPLVVLVYFLIPRKMRYIWLLAASYYFYMCWNAKYALLLFFSTAVTWLAGLAMEHVSGKEWEAERILIHKKICVGVSFGLNLSLLFFFKYFYFAVDNLNFLLEKMHLNIISPGLDIILPVGISFYIFQALSYTVDVYRQEIKAEKNLARYALFVSFFPQLVAGPIERSKNLLTQIEQMDRLKLWNYERIRNGVLLMIWGFFQKLVIADRIAIVVNQVFDSYQEYGLVELGTTAILFSFQIYCDFAGYSTIAKGAAEVMGFQLMDNFTQPYLAVDIKDFWRRWHISLTTWFTDYLYIPLGGNRKGKKKQCRNILIVFLCSGLWHGANWTYVVWGLLHGCAQVMGNVFKWCIPKWCIPKRKENNSWWRKTAKVAVNFAVVTVFWVFFRANNMKDALGYFLQCLKYPRLHSFTDMGLNEANWIVLIIAIGILAIVDLLHEKGMRIRQQLYTRCFLVRGTVYLAAVWLVILFGVYGFQYDASQFIYFQF